MGSGFRAYSIAHDLIRLGWASPRAAAALLARTPREREHIEALTHGPGRPPCPGRILFRSADSNGGSWGLGVGSGAREVGHNFIAAIEGELRALQPEGDLSIGGMTDRGLYFRAYWIPEALCRRIFSDPAGLLRDGEARAQAAQEAADAARARSETMRTNLETRARIARALESRLYEVQARLKYGTPAYAAVYIAYDAAREVVHACDWAARQAIPGAYSTLTPEEQAEALARADRAWAACPTEEQVSALEK